MSECMLCQSKRAERPHLIEPVGLRIWSVEELIYFMRNNLTLLDEELLDEKLTAWIKDELRMRRLASILAQVISKPFSVRDYLLPIYHETGYPGEDEIRRTLNALEDLEALPAPVRLKKKADALTGYHRYLRAIGIYRQVLEYQKSSHLGAQFTGMIYGNIGAAYARLFQMEEACSFLKESYTLLHSSDAARRYLSAVYLKDGRQAFLAAAEELEMDEAARKKIEDAIAAVRPPERAGRSPRGTR